MPIAMDCHRPLSAKAKKIILRLDNGSVIGHGGRFGLSSDEPVLLQIEQAVRKGVSGHQDVDRLQRFCETLSASTHHPTSRPSAITPAPLAFEKRDPEPVPAQQAAPAVKRQREQHAMNGTAHADATPFAQQQQHVAAAAAPALPGNWESKCRRILDKVLRNLGQNAAIFDRPVDTTKVLDYLKIIKQPMDLGTMRKRLDKHMYSSPAEFCADMRLVWQNCKLYNKPKEFIARLGVKASTCFEKEWANSGLNRFEALPHVADGGGDAAPRKRSKPSSTATAPKPEPLAALVAAPLMHVAQPSKPPSIKPEAVAGEAAPSVTRTKSTEVTSSAPPHESKPMPHERMQLIAIGLSQIDGTEHIDGALAIVKEGGSGGGDDGEEIELDIDTLPPPTLWKLDAYLQHCLGAKYGVATDDGEHNAAGENNNPNNVIVEQDSEDDDEDSDYESDD